VALTLSSGALFSIENHDNPSQGSNVTLPLANGPAREGTILGHVRQNGMTSFKIMFNTYPIHSMDRILVADQHIFA